MRILLFIISIFAFTINSFAQDNFLEKGNNLLNQNKFYEAEKLFREALKSDSTNLVYQTQLSLALIQQEKFFDAQPIIEKVLIKDSLNKAALWYGGLNNYLNPVGDKRKVITYLEKLLIYIPESSPQYFAANWYLGKSYRKLLESEGLNYEEVSKMIDAFSIYTELQPDAEDTKSISAYVEHIKKVRAPKGVKKWINIPEGKIK